MSCFLINLIFEILIGMQFGEDQRANITKTHVYTRLDYVFEYQELLYT